MAVQLYVDGILKARPATIEEARSLASEFIQSECECVVISRTGGLSERRIYDYDLKAWVKRA